MANINPVKNCGICGERGHCTKEDVGGGHGKRDVCDLCMDDLDDDEGKDSGQKILNTCSDCEGPCGTSVDQCGTCYAEAGAALAT